MCFSSSIFSILLLFALLSGHFNVLASQQVCYNLNFVTPKNDGESFWCQDNGSDRTFAVKCTNCAEAAQSFFLDDKCNQDGNDCNFRYCITVADDAFTNYTNQPSILVFGVNSGEDEDDAWTFTLKVDDQVVTAYSSCSSQVPNLSVCYCSGQFLESTNYIALGSTNLFVLSAPDNREGYQVLPIVIGSLSGLLVIMGLVIFALFKHPKKKPQETQSAEDHKSYLNSNLSSDVSPKKFHKEEDLESFTAIPPVPALTPISAILPTPSPIALKVSDSFRGDSNQFSNAPTTLVSTSSKNPKYKSRDAESFGSFYSRNFATRSSVIISKPRNFSVLSYRSKVTEEDKEFQRNLRDIALQRTSFREGKSNASSVGLRSMSPSISKESEARLLRLQTVIVDCVVKAAATSLDLKSVSATATPAMTEFRRVDDNGMLLRQISLVDFLIKIKHYVNEWCEDDDAAGNSIGVKALLLSLIYLRRVKKLFPKLEVNDSNIRNLFFVGIILATKFLDDWIIPSNYWADLVGVDVNTLIEMEKTFCNYIDYDFFVSERKMKKLILEFEENLE